SRTSRDWASPPDTGTHPGGIGARRQNDGPDQSRPAKGPGTSDRAATPAGRSASAEAGYECCAPAPPCWPCQFLLCLRAFTLVSETAPQQLGRQGVGWKAGGGC